MESKHTKHTFTGQLSLLYDTGGGDFLESLMECSIKGCQNKTHGKGYCKKHYLRLWRHGDPMGGSKTFVGEPMQFFNSLLKADDEDCITWPFNTTTGGYGKFLWQGREEIVTRVLLRLLVGNPENEKMHASHSCGKGKFGCVNPKHLRWATAAENANDKIDHGTMPRGETHCNAKLTEDDVRAIRDDSRRYKEISKEFGINVSGVCKIKNGTTWKHVR